MGLECCPAFKGGCFHSAKQVSGCQALTVGEGKRLTTKGNNRELEG